MDFQFGEFEIGKSKTDNNNMEDILDKVDKYSIDWENFEAPGDASQDISQSNVSEMFNKSKKEEQSRPQSRDDQNSRDIMEISAIYGQSFEKSFRFEREDYREQPNSNERYSKFQNLLEKAKKNNLDQFYKNLDRQKQAYPEQGQKFQDYRNFKSFTKTLKENKKQKQAKYQEPKPKAKQINNLFGYEEPVRDFSRKENQKNLLPVEFNDEDFFSRKQSENESERPNPISKYNNFYEGDKLPDFIPEHNRLEDAEEFFDIQPRLKQDRDKDKCEKQAKQTLQAIREQKHNSFEKTFEEEKLNKLLNNYQEMKVNFEDLMKELKSTNQGQERLVDELKRLQQQKNEEEREERRREKNERKEREMFERNKKLDLIKDEITRIKGSEKDILYLKINEKIEHLQSVVRIALEEVNEEKQVKINAKVINYFCDHLPYGEKNQQNGSRQKEEASFSQDSMMKELQINVNANVNEQAKPKLSEKCSPKNSNAKSSSKKQSPQSSYSKLQQQIGSPPPYLGRGSQSRSRNSPNYDIDCQNEYCSPLDLHLESFCQNTSIITAQVFEPAEFAEQYFPKELANQNRNLKNCLTQKSSVVYESFDFHVSARFNMTDNALYPITAIVRVGNKCSINLLDVHTIVYGPQGPSVLTEPSKIFNEQLPKNSSYSFQVSVNKQCIEQNGFSLQISYKIDSMSKKKLNFKIPLPLIQMIRPQFVYQQKFQSSWNTLTNELYIRPKKLDYNYLRSHEDLKLFLPLINLSEEDPNVFSYGLMFRYPKSENIFFFKMMCHTNGKASLHLRSQKTADGKLKEEILDCLNFIFLSPI